MNLPVVLGQIYPLHGRNPWMDADYAFFEHLATELLPAAASSTEQACELLRVMTARGHGWNHRCWVADDRLEFRRSVHDALTDPSSRGPYRELLKIGDLGLLILREAIALANSTGYSDAYARFFRPLIRQQLGDSAIVAPRGSETIAQIDVRDGCLHISE